MRETKTNANTNLVFGGGGWEGTGAGAGQRVRTQVGGQRARVNRAPTRGPPVNRRPLSTGDAPSAHHQKRKTWLQLPEPSDMPAVHGRSVGNSTHAVHMHSPQHASSSNAAQPEHSPKTALGAGALLPWPTAPSGRLPRLKQPFCVGCVRVSSAGRRGGGGVMTRGPERVPHGCIAQCTRAPEPEEPHARAAPSTSNTTAPPGGWPGPP